jgi:tetratricopeptide (TPR) repeat protein
MSTLHHEQRLHFDRDLDRRLEAVGPKSPAAAWLSAAVALSLRSLPHIAADLTERGLAVHPKEDGLWLLHIQAVAIYPEKLKATWEDLSSRRSPPKGQQVLLALVEYYQERDKEGLARLEGVPKRGRNAMFFEVCGHYAMARHEYKQAAKAYLQAHKLASKDLRIMVDLGESFNALGDRERAIQWLYRVVTRERHCIPAWNALCQIYLDSGDATLARQAMGMALAVNPRDWGVYFTFADHFLDTGEYPRAKAILQEILDLQPRDVIAAEVHNYLGYLDYLQGNYADALPSFKRALDLNPSLAVAWSNLGNLHFHRKEHDEAEACYREALKADPHFASAACQLGLSQLEQGILDRAREPLERALALDPGEYWAHLGLSEYHRRTKNPVASLEEARAALRLAPEDPNVQNYLGIALETNRRYFDAEKAYQRALDLNPRHRWAANNLGYLYEKIMRVDSGYKSAAIEAWKLRLVICRDTGASVRGAINHLKKLGVTGATIRNWLNPGS